MSAQSLGASTTISGWQEVEIELTGGDMRLLEAADRRLRRDGLRRAEHSAKLERALADRLPGPLPRAGWARSLPRRRCCWPTCAASPTR